MFDETLQRSRSLFELIRQHPEEKLRKIIEEQGRDLEFNPIGELGISDNAWAHTNNSQILPELVFAHPFVLQYHPETSLYYRGIALVSRKRVQQHAVSVNEWESGNRSKSVKPEAAKRVAFFYNSVISSIIDGSTNWTLDDAVRSIVATMGITFDGSFRNTIGTQAESLVKSRIAHWIGNHEKISEIHTASIRKDFFRIDAENGESGSGNISDIMRRITLQTAPKTGKYSLPEDTIMVFGSEPDISFVRNGATIATIEIKGGKDPAGALERLGAMTKSFTKTPPNCTNFLVAGVVTTEMQTRLNEMGNVKVFLLDDLSMDGETWDTFMDEIFHYTLRIV